MKYSLADFILEFKTPFQIAHGTRLGTDIVLLTLNHEGISATGEASLPPYLTETPVSVREFIDSFFDSGNVDFTNLENSLSNLHQYQIGNFAAKTCIDIAIHNWFAAKNGIPVYKLLGLQDEPLPLCTFTIGMDTRMVFEEKIKEAAEFKILKIKLGGANDKEIISTIRELTEKPLCIDVNQGWKEKEFALEMINWLSDKNVLFVEQPLPKGLFDDQLWLFERSIIPLYADESVQTPADIPTIADRYHGINIKLMKCGGIYEAMKMIRLTRHFGLKIMIGSMSETGCAINAAAQLSSLADFTDLDGPLLTKNNPFDIVKYKNGKVIPV